MLTKVLSDTAKPVRTETNKRCVCAKARQLSRVITRRYDAALRQLGITNAQCILLREIVDKETVTSVMIGKALDIDKSTLSRNLERLVALGCITMGPLRGRQGRLLSMTKSGIEILSKAERLWHPVNEDILVAIGSEYAEHIDTILKRLK